MLRICNDALYGPGGFTWNTKNVAIDVHSLGDPSMSDRCCKQTQRSMQLDITEMITVDIKAINKPVLSVRRYEIRPSCSGMVLARTTVPGILESFLIIQLNTILPMSRLTRKLVTREIQSLHSE